MKKDCLRVQAYLGSHIGKKRENQEDNFIFAGKISLLKSEQYLEYQHSLDEPLLFGVFDGMGGLSYGSRASEICAQLCQSYVLHPRFLLEDLKALCIIANERVFNEMRQLKTNMGSTLSLVILYQDQLYLANVGDSPIYLYRAGELITLHEEHTERHLYERLYGPSAKKKKYRLTQNIGMDVREMQMQPHVIQIPLIPGDIVLLSSDGLSDMLSQEVIATHCRQFSHAIARDLIDAALYAGGRDNITLICGKIEKGDEDNV